MIQEKSAESRNRTHVRGYLYTSTTLFFVGIVFLVVIWFSYSHLFHAGFSLPAIYRGELAKHQENADFIKSYCYAELETPEELAKRQRGTKCIDAITLSRESVLLKTCTIFFYKEVQFHCSWCTSCYESWWCYYGTLFWLWEKFGVNYITPFITMLWTAILGYTMKKVWQALYPLYENAKREREMVYSKKLDQQLPTTTF